MFYSSCYLQQSQNSVNLHEEDVEVSLKSRNILLSLPRKYFLQQQGKPFSGEKLEEKKQLFRKIRSVYSYMLYDMEKQSFFMSIVKADFFKMGILEKKREKYI